MMALAGLNMDRVLPVTVGVWPFVAGMGVGSNSVPGTASDGAGVRLNEGSHQRLLRLCGLPWISSATLWVIRMLSGRTTGCSS